MVMMEQITKKTSNFIIEHVESPGFFLILNFADANPEFTRYLEFASQYESFDIAMSVIERVRLKGFTMLLQVRPIVTEYRVGV
jgi:hypothetical protein